jgi:hypothetical protein
VWPNYTTPLLHLCQFFPETIAYFPEGGNSSQIAGKTTVFINKAVKKQMD